MEQAQVYILLDDIELIRQQLKAFSSYDLAADIAARMKGLKLSQSVLAARAQVSHTMVAKWLNKGAKPHGKERFKELGMALGMDESQLNIFLQANCYPKLYMKNPLDIACRFVLSNSAGDEHIVAIYRDFLKIYKLDGYVLRKDFIDISTANLSRDFSHIDSIISLEAWLTENSKYFQAFDKRYIPHAELMRFVLSYIGEQNINNLYRTGELPKAIKNMLYPLIADKEIAVKGLRAKLIVFGLYENMTEYEINIMLDIAKLQSITEPSSRIDHVILTALRCAHERYPYFEMANAVNALKRFNEKDMPDLYSFYNEQKRRAAELVRYYEAAGHKNEADCLFEKYYTAYADKGILDYVSDILTLLVERGLLAATEANEYAALMKTY